MRDRDGRDGAGRLHDVDGETDDHVEVLGGERHPSTGRISRDKAFGVTTQICRVSPGIHAWWLALRRSVMSVRGGWARSTMQETVPGGRRPSLVECAQAVKA